MDILKRISTTLGLVALTAAPALAQVATPARNQMTADRVAEALRPVASQSGSRIEIETRAGLVTLIGTVANPTVKADLIARTQQVAGVVAVADRLRIAGDSRVRPAQYQPMPAQAVGGQPIDAGQPPQVAMGGHHRGGAVYGDGAMMGPVNSYGPGEPVMMDTGPMPEGAAGAGITQAAIAGAPNYAWPTSTPGANAAGVGYPTTYPWQAQANASPPYPNPEIPLDWRTVTLRWDDGIWWLDYKKHYTRPFFTPWPFGILPY